MVVTVNTIGPIFILSYFEMKHTQITLRGLLQATGVWLSGHVKRSEFLKHNTSVSTYSHAGAIAANCSDISLDMAVFLRNSAKVGGEQWSKYLSSLRAEVIVWIGPIVTTEIHCIQEGRIVHPKCPTTK